MPFSLQKLKNAILAGFVGMVRLFSHRLMVEKHTFMALAIASWLSFASLRAFLTYSRKIHFVRFSIMAHAIFLCNQLMTE
jgi:hypothetical protein